MAYSINNHYSCKTNIIIPQPKPHHYTHYPTYLRTTATTTTAINKTVLCCHEQQQQQQQQKHSKANNEQMNRREVLLRSSKLATLGAIFHFSGTKPSYLGVQKNPPALALCPATKNCISTSENSNDLTHYAPPWNYNPERKENRGSITREVAMQELLDVIKTTKPDKFSPRIIEVKDDYVRVEYESPILGFVDDVEFWFPPGKKSIVEYRSASRLGNFDFDVNRKRIKALRQELEKKGWASENTY